MNRAAPILLSLLLPALVLAVEPADGPVRVEFEKPEAYTDARTDRSHGKGASESVTRGLSKYLQRVAPAYLAAGQQLEVVFTDIDLAGDYEPGTNLSLYDVRLVKSIYPPRLRFRWSLLDANGGVLRQGEEDIRDLGFQTSVTGSDRTPLRYEQHILRRWLQDTLPRAS
jgi:GAF domain-containing protein